MQRAANASSGRARAISANCVSTSQRKNASQILSPRPVYAHAIEPVIPIAATDERQAMRAEFQPVLDGPHTMFIKSS